MAGLTVDLELEQVRAIVGDLDRMLDPVGYERLHGGVSDVYRIDLAGTEGPLVLKIYADEPQWVVAKEALVARWMDGRAGLPIPRWLRVDESRTRIPLRFALTTWLPGVTVRSLIGAPGIDDAYRQMGALLRRLHAIPMSAYGYIVADGIQRPRPTNDEYMRLAFDQVFRQFRELCREETFARRLEEKAQSRFDLLRHSRGPVLCHDDLQQGNVLAEFGGSGSLSLTGLIDFGNARAGDALFDLAKTLLCCIHEDPRSREPLLAGYGEIGHPDAEEALRLYTLFHRVSMWCWLTRRGEASDGPADLLRDLDAMFQCNIKLAPRRGIELRAKIKHLPESGTLKRLVQSRGFVKAVSHPERTHRSQVGTGPVSGWRCCVATQNFIAPLLRAAQHSPMSGGNVR